MWCAKERLLERLILFLGRVANDWMRTWIWVEPTGMETALHCCFLCLESNLERNWKKHRRLIKLQHPTFCCIAFEVRYFSYPLYTCITLLKSLFEHLIQNCRGGGVGISIKCDISLLTYSVMGHLSVLCLHKIKLTCWVGKRRSQHKAQYCPSALI